MGNRVKICAVCWVEFILAEKMRVMSQLIGLDSVGLAAGS
tara:strand:- start:90 stop:209 length:120 start_codon:yes stop_codon:yes gene_type:complete